MRSEDPIRAVSVITAGEGEVHHEHVYGTRKPELVWILFGRRWVCLPINVYVIDHEDGLVLFDTGQDRAVVTDPHSYPDRITAFVYRHIFRNIRIGPDDTLPVQLERAGYSAAQGRALDVLDRPPGGTYSDGAVELRSARPQNHRPPWRACVYLNDDPYFTNS